MRRVAALLQRDWRQPREWPAIGAATRRQVADHEHIGIPRNREIELDPNDRLAAEAGLAVDDGILVDETLRTSDPAVFAAGDVARFWSPALGRRIRAEHEDNANCMGREAGRAMAGADAAYRHLPFFYSDLFDLGYEAVGVLDPRLDVVADWKEPFRRGVVYYLGDGRVRGVLAWGVFGQMDAARNLIAEPGPHDPEALSGRILA